MEGDTRESNDRQGSATRSKVHLVAHVGAGCGKDRTGQLFDTLVRAQAKAESVYGGTTNEGGSKNHRNSNERNRALLHHAGEDGTGIRAAERKCETIKVRIVLRRWNHLEAKETARKEGGRNEQAQTADMHLRILHDPIQTTAAGRNNHGSVSKLQSERQPRDDV